MAEGFDFRTCGGPTTRRGIRPPNKVERWLWHRWQDVVEIYRTLTFYDCPCDDARPVWTASYPCQPFSSAGKWDVHKDERHLWPEPAAVPVRAKDALDGEDTDG